MRADDTTPDTRLSDDMNFVNPAVTETLTRLMLGGLPAGRLGFPLHCRVRYFDPARRRAGIPEDVAALVERLTGDETTLTLVNVSPLHAREVIVQGGAYAEHQILSAEQDGQTLQVNGDRFAVRLAPGAGGRIKLRMKRYANPPTMAFPWDRA
jgi:hypothetical protein